MLMEKLFFTNVFPGQAEVTPKIPDVHELLPTMSLSRLEAVCLLPLRQTCWTQNQTTTKCFLSAKPWHMCNAKYTCTIL